MRRLGSPRNFKATNERIKARLQGSFDAAHGIPPRIYWPLEGQCASIEKHLEGLKQYMIGYDYTIKSLYGKESRS